MTFTPSNENTPLARGVVEILNADSGVITTEPTSKRNFSGTENPRELRAIAALTRRPMPREELDREAGCSNSPDLVANLRRKGLEVPCDRVSVIDRDGFETRRGVYHLAPADRRKLNSWLSRRGQA